MKPQTQDDIVRQDQGYKPQEVTRKVLLPGIEQLHTKPVNEIAEVLANVLRMERGVTKFTWEVGKHIELTIDQSQV